MYDCVIGIDPGAAGGMAALVDGCVSVCKMPRNPSDISTFLQYYKENFNPVVFIEKLAIRRDDLTGGKVFRIKKMIANYEQFKAVISLSGLPYCEIHPLTWQSRLNLRQAGEEKPHRKKRYKDVAQLAYPSVTATMWNCDALLIMRCGDTMLRSGAKKDERWMAENLVRTNEDKGFF